MKKIVITCTVTVLLLSTAAAPTAIQGDSPLDIDGGIHDTMPAAGCSDGDTLYVGGSGPDNYTTIQAAVDAARDGDTVFVYDDSSPYQENVVVRKSILLVGEEKNTTVVDGGRTTHDGVLVGADGVTISHLTIRNSGTYEGSGIHLRSDGNRVSQTVLYNNSCGITLSKSNDTFLHDNYFISGNEGIHLWNTDDIHIQRNLFINNSYRGIHADRIGNCTIADNLFSNNSCGMAMVNHSSDNLLYSNSFYQDGVFVRASSHNTFVDNTVNGKPLVYLEGQMDVEIPENAGQIILVNCSHLTIKGYNLSTVPFPFILISTDHIIVENNTVQDAYVGVWLHHSSHNHISGNKLTGTQEQAIELESSHDNEIVDNTIVENRWGGIRLSFSRRNTISSNMVNSNPCGITIGSLSNRNVVADNEVCNNTNYGITIQGGSFNRITGNNVSGNREWCGISILHFFSCGNLVSRNTISSNHWVGIDLEGVGNIIRKNDISHNTRYGLFVEGAAEQVTTLNVISHNNFIDNGKNAGFHTRILNHNFWYRNYWSDWRLPLPKPIKGTAYIWVPYRSFEFPWLNVDLCPRLLPASPD